MERIFYLKIGQIDRIKLAQFVFFEKSKKEVLDKLTLEFVVPRIKELAEIKSNKNVVVIDAPLLFEMSLDKFCDRTIGIIANKDTCIKRISQRDKIDKDVAKARINSQNDTNFFKINCDYCVNNDENDDLEKQINEIFDNKNLSNQHMIHLYNEKLEYLQFRELLKYSEDIEHCYTLKPLDFNIGDKEKVLKDYNKICNALHLNSNKIFRPQQTHSNTIKKVETENPGIYKKEFQNVDGLITNKADKILSLTFADCICLYFYDPVKKVIGNIHSGWKGTYQEIAKTAVQYLKNEYGVNPENLICGIAPNIRNCCFEVDEDIKDRFYHKFKNLEEIDEVIQKSGDNNKYYIDTVIINKVILKKEGLKENNIIDNEICTKCNSDKLHSYRVEKDKAGRNTGMILLRERKNNKDG